MPRPGSTSQRGYGPDHQRRTAQLKADMRAAGGATCGRGGEWMHAWQLDLPHTHPQSVDGDHLDLPAALGGRAEHLTLTCAHHNRQHGARLGNSARGRGGLPPLPPPPSRSLAPKTSRAW